jgi:hypothetical protein
MSAAYCAVCGETYVKSGTRRTCGHPRCIRTWARHRRMILTGTDQVAEEVLALKTGGLDVVAAVDRVATRRGMTRGEVLSRWRAMP